jgi:DNA-binding CsgD family transcriptional regulator
MLVRIKDDLPLNGKFAGPRREAAPLLTTEYSVVRFLAEGHSEGAVAAMTKMTIERVDQLRERALAKLAARGPKDAMRKLSAQPERLPYAMRNRKRRA